MKILMINAKCSDSCITTISDNSLTVYEKDGYVPKIRGVGNGDYINLKIDIETGTVLNFNKEDILSLIVDEDENC